MAFGSTLAGSQVAARLPFASAGRRRLAESRFTGQSRVTGTGRAARRALRAACHTGAGETDEAVSTGAVRAAPLAAIAAIVRPLAHTLEAHGTPATVVRCRAHTADVDTAYPARTAEVRATVELVDARGTARAAAQTLLAQERAVAGEVVATRLVVRSTAWLIHLQEVGRLGNIRLVYDTPGRTGRRDRCEEKRCQVPGHPALKKHLPQSAGKYRPVPTRCWRGILRHAL